MLRAVFAVSGLAFASQLWAATFTVTRLDDPLPNGCLPTDCSLREAVIAANATIAADVVQLGNGTHELTRVCLPDTQSCQDLDVTRPLTIQGNGSAATEIINAIPFNASPNTTDRSHTRVIEASNTLTLRNLRLRKGYVASVGANVVQGGCLLANQAASTLENVVVTDCSVAGVGFSRGGAVAIVDASSVWSSVTVSNSSIRGGSGGGVFLGNALQQPEFLTGNDVLITGNRAPTGGGVYVVGNHVLGGAVLALGGTSRISHNQADFGGGVASYVYAQIRGEKSQLLEISNNLANDSCGGISVSGHSVTSMLGDVLSNLSVASNVAKTNGGGICISTVGFATQNWPVRIRDTEVINNYAGRDGGALRILHGQATDRTVLERVSLSHNRSTRGAAVHADTGTLTMTHVSSYDNDSTTGAIHILAGSAELAHVTSFEDKLSIEAGGTTRLFASVMNSSCAGNVQDGGYNFVLNGVAGCPGTVTSAGNLALAFDDFGGLFRVVGIAGSSSLLRDMVPPTAGATDVRGWTRQNQHDAGAHEYDGLNL